MSSVHRNPKPAAEMIIPYDSFKVLTFDVVGTLIDFETGVLDAVRRIGGGKAAELSDQAIFASYKRGRDAHPERSSEVMFHVYRSLAKELGLSADDAACDAFQLAVLRRQPFLDSVEASGWSRRPTPIASRCHATRMRSAIPSTIPSAPIRPASPSQVPNSSPTTRDGRRPSATSSQTSCT
jgi:hypothetical protein